MNEKVANAHLSKQEKAYLFALLCMVFLWPSAALSAQIVTNSNNAGTGSFRGAVTDAASGDTIQFHPSLSGRTISLLSPVNSRSDIALKYAVTGGGYVLIAPGATYTGNGLVQHTSASANRAYGGGLFVAGVYSGNLNATVTNRTASPTPSATGDALAFGGGVRVDNDVGSFSGRVSGNTASGRVTAGAGYALAHGGGVSFNGNLGRFSGMVNGNVAEATGVATVVAQGGGIYAHTNIASIGGIIAGNSASAFTTGASPQLSVQTAAGGGIYVREKIGSVSGAVVGNQAKAEVTGGITNRTASANGGGVYVQDFIAGASGKNSINAISGTVVGNTAEAVNKGLGNTESRGGGVFSYDSIGSIIANAVISGNSLSATGARRVNAYGGGVYAGSTNNASGTMDTLAGTVSNNAIVITNTSKDAAAVTDSSGAGVHVENIGILSGTIFNNSIVSRSIAGNASALGAGVNSRGSVTEISGLIAGNTANAIHSESDIAMRILVSGGGAYVEKDIGAISGKILNNIASAQNAGNAEALGGGIRAQNIGNITGMISGNVLRATSQTGAARALGGGLYVDTPNSILISGGIIANNQALASSVSGTARAEGGGVFLNTLDSAGNNRLTLAPTTGDIVFQGNSVNANGVVTPNDLHFGRRITTLPSGGNASLAIAGGAFGVLLRGGVAVDMNNGRSFAMTAAAPTRGFHWGGPNNFDAAGGSAVNLNSGSVTLLSDFQLFSGNINSVGTDNVTASLTSGLNLNLDLTTRPQDAALPMFVNPAAFEVTGGGKVNVSPRLYRLDEIVGEWQIVNKKYDGVLSDDFNAISTDLFSASLRQHAADDLWISASNTVAVNMVRNHANPNVRNAYNSRALIDGWNRELSVLDLFAVDDIYRNLLANPQWCVPEAYMTHGWVALDWSRHIGEKFTAYDRWSRRAYDQAVSAIASGEAMASPSYSPSRPRYRAWAAYVGSDANQDNRDGYYGYDANLNGVLAGFSFDFTPCLTAGTYFSYAYGSAKYDDLQSRIDTNAYQGGVFADFRLMEKLDLGFDASFAWYDDQARRDNQFGAYHDDFDQQVFGAGLNARYNLDLSANTRIIPYLTARYQHLWQSGIDEAGANPIWATHMGKTSADSFATALGTAFAHDFRTSDLSVVTPSLYAAWRHEFADRQISSTANYLNSPLTYTMSSVKRERDSADLGIDVKASFNLKSGRSIEINAGYGVNLTRNYVNQSWYAGLGIRF